MRLTFKNGKKRTNTSAIHNNRDFNIDKAKHIDRSRIKDNYTYTITEKPKDQLLKDYEIEYYRKHFTPWINEQNERYKKNRHKEKCKSIEDIYNSNIYKPVETILQIGTKDDNISPEDVKKIGLEYIEFIKKNYPNYTIITANLHNDEATPHWHIRGVYTYTDKDGLKRIGQSKGLREMNIERPDLTKPEDKFNNPKMTFDKQCRDFLFETAKAYGYNLEQEALTYSGSLETIDYKKQEEAKKLSDLKLQVMSVERELNSKSITKDIMEKAEKIDIPKYKKGILGNITMKEEEFDDFVKIKQIDKGLNEVIEDIEAERNKLNNLKTELDKQTDKIKKTMSSKEYKVISQSIENLKNKKTMLQEETESIDKINKSLKEENARLLEVKGNAPEQTIQIIELEDKLKIKEDVIELYKTFIAQQNLIELFCNFYNAIKQKRNKIKNKEIGYKDQER